eukprot:9492102-Pyramimonas_sp.AAC.1
MPPPFSHSARRRGWRRTEQVKTHFEGVYGRPRRHSWTLLGQQAMVDPPPPARGLGTGLEQTMLVPCLAPPRSPSRC